MFNIIGHPRQAVRLWHACLIVFCVILMTLTSVSSK